MEEKRNGPGRRTLILLTVTIALCFALALVVAANIVRAVPEARETRIEAALSADDFARARRIAGRFSNDARCEEWLRRCDLAEASSDMERGDWDAARALLLPLGSFENAAALEQECRFRQAEEAAAGENWETAEALYRSITGRKDAQERADDAKYHWAEQEQRSGNSGQALRLFLDLGNYGDAPAQAQLLAKELTGESDPQKALLLAQDLSEEQIALREELRRQRSRLPRDVIDVGFYHTVARTADGRALACGSDEYGQCGVSGWTDITAIAAGAYHTVGLRSDGTVVAVGRSTEGQCATEDWTDITAIAAADWATFGLRSDGTIVWTGYNDYGEVSGWTDIASITGGSYALGALRSNGEALLSHRTARSDELTGLVSLAVNTAFAVGCRADGTVVSPAFALNGWEKILAVSASGTAVLGLASDGTVRSFAFRASDLPDTFGLSDVCAIAAGGTHFAFVHTDGSVTVRGENGCGQTDTQNWKLF